MLKHMHAPTLNVGRKSIFRKVGIKPHLIRTSGEWQLVHRPNERFGRPEYAKAVEWCMTMNRKALLAQLICSRR